MKIAITGGTGFIGYHLARELVRAGHCVVLIARDKRAQLSTFYPNPLVQFWASDLSDQESLVQGLIGCDAIAHCAGINREIGSQTYENVHVKGTHHVVAAAKTVGIKKVLLLSFLRARPSCHSSYHESKWMAEEIVRTSGLEYTILKAGVIYGKGDHMLDHLAHALHSFPIFALIGMKEKGIRPTAVEDVVRIIRASLVEGRLQNKTVAVLGPEEMPLSAAVRRVAKFLGKRPLYFRLPIFFHYILGWIFERLMVIPLTAIAQVRILSEGIVEPLPYGEPLPDDLQPKLFFNEEQIREGLPERKGFGLQDLRCFKFMRQP